MSNLYPIEGIKAELFFMKILIDNFFLLTNYCIVDLMIEYNVSGK